MEEKVKLRQVNIRYKIDDARLSWRDVTSITINFWCTDLHACLSSMKNITKGFIVALILHEIYLKHKGPDFSKFDNVTAVINRLTHVGGCLYELYKQNTWTVKKELEPELRKYDIKIDFKRCYHKDIVGFVLGNKYTKEYRNNLVTTYKLKGLI